MIVLTGVGATLCTDLWPSCKSACWASRPLTTRWSAAGLSACSTAGFITLRSWLRRCAGRKSDGWLLHYAIGVAFAFIPLAWRPSRVRRADAAGRAVERLAEPGAPFFVMQPALGFGVAAANTPIRRVAASSACCAYGVRPGLLSPPVCCPFLA
ncbi:DUF2938 family protein [Serratia marcescens]